MDDLNYHELLLEIGCEEIPASWLPAVTRQLGERLMARLDEAHLTYRTPARTWNTPRRLAACVPALAERQAAFEEIVTGPPVRAAFGPDGEPTPAAHGFARKRGVAATQLVRVETPRGEYLAHRRRQRGSTARQLLPALFAATLRDLTFPKPMHWDAWLDDGRGEFVFGRPIRWLVLLYGGRVVPFTIERSKGAATAGVGPVKSGNVTYGHRFFAKQGKPGIQLRVNSFADYRVRLRDAYVIIDRDERRARINRKLDTCAKRVDCLVAPVRKLSSLLEEVPDLVECPSVVTGSFPSEFLDLPDEVLSTTMIHHQHFFPVVNRQGRLKQNFLAVTNTPRDNVRKVARNAERVLVARLRDARFFWDADRKTRLEDRLKRLDTLLFHTRLGSYRSKAERVGSLAEHIAREIFDASGISSVARRAGTLCKVDLTTDMVSEFPELQGVMGGVYAREHGEPEEVWKAIYYHYLPVGIEVDAPPSRRDLGAAGVTWAAVALADKLDTVVGLFQAGEKPTGSRDPFGMRRQAQGLIRILVDLPELTGLGTRVSVGQLLELGHSAHGRPAPDVEERETAFLLERARYLLEERGFDVRNVRSVTHQQSLDELRPLDARRKLEALPEFTGSSEFQQLATVFKRVKNITRQHEAELRGAEVMDDSLDRILVEPSERELLEEIGQRRSLIDGAVTSGKNFRRAFQEASKFGPAVDRFFTEVFVMVDDARVRNARLRLMKQLEQLITQLADVSEIVPED